MTNIEKIRQEFERRRDICKGIFERDSDTYYQGKAVAYDESISIIDSLPEEFPPYCTGFKGDPDPAGTSDLEEAAEELFETIEIQEHENIFEDTFKKIFIAGAEWMREKMKKEEVEGAIWEAINRYELEKKLNHEEGR